MHKINEIKIYTLMSTKITNMQQLLFLLCDIVNVSRNNTQTEGTTENKLWCYLFYIEIKQEKVWKYFEFVFYISYFHCIVSWIISSELSDRNVVNRNYILFYFS